MNSVATILTSAVVAASVASLFNLLGQIAERRARSKELILVKALELAKARREFVVMVAEKSGKTARLADDIVHAETYYQLLKALHETGSLPANWRERVKQKADEVYGPE